MLTQRHLLASLSHSPGRKRASGGSGGSGGNVFIVGDPNLFSLKFNTYHFNAGNGRHGGSKCCDDALYDLFVANT